MPNWEQLDEESDPQLHPEIADYVAGRTIIVGGLWRQICVFHVTRLLQQRYGDAIRLFNGDILSIPYEYAVTTEEQFEALSLKEACAEYELTMQLI